MANEVKPRPTIRVPHDSPRLVLPRTLLAVVHVLLDELDDLPDARRVELRTAANLIARAFRLPLPGGPADSIQLEHELNPEEDFDAP